MTSRLKNRKHGKKSIDQANRADPNLIAICANQNLILSIFGQPGDIGFVAFSCVTVVLKWTYRWVSDDITCLHFDFIFWGDSPRLFQNNTKMEENSFRATKANCTAMC